MPNTAQQVSRVPSASPGSLIPVWASREPTIQTSPFHTKHAALRGNPPLTPDEWFNVNHRIRKTVDIILPHGYLIEGPGPEMYKLSSHLGVALCAEIVIRPLQAPCSLADPVLQKKPKGRVWFFFRILDITVARKPLDEDA